MRLSQNEIELIKNALAPFLKGEKAELRLYGSRLREDARGGDIDLLLLVKKADKVNLLNEQKHYLLAALKQLIGDQKIDLIIMQQSNAKKDPFVRLILEDSHLLISFK